MNPIQQISTDRKMFDIAIADGILLKNGEREVRFVPEPAPAPVNTQGGGLREKMEDLVENYGSDPDDAVSELVNHIRAALAQAEQAQPAPVLGLSIQDALLQLRSASGNVLVALSIDVSLQPCKPGVPDSYRTSFNAFAHLPGNLESTRGYSLPGVLTDLLAKLSPANQPGATTIEETDSLLIHHV